MKLTDTACRNAKPKEKPYKLADGGGLYMFIQPDGRKYWRLRYRYLGKEKVLALGVYPDVSLAEAREARKTAKKTLAAGVDPVEAKRSNKRKAVLNAANTFEAAAREWHSNQLEKWSEDHAQNVLHRMEMDIFPYIGNRPIGDIDAPELLEVLRRVEKRNALDIARRVRGICGQVFRYGIATGRCKRDIASDLKDALRTVKTKHFAALEIKEVPGFLQALERNDARLYARTRRAIKLLMHVFVRPIELTEAKWSEFDFEAKEWHIPAERMKMRKPHIVPLSRQVIALLREQQEETGHLNTDWVFPSQIRPKDPMSNGTILVAIKRMGFSGRQTAHGFRAIARSTIREKLGYAPDIIERQLAHGKRNKVEAAYDRAQFLDQRKRMMQEWSNYLDALAQDNKVIVARFGKNP